MKAIILILAIIFANSCEEQLKDMETTAIEYTANTRGFFQQIIVRDQIATISRDRDGIAKPEVIKISDADWKSLVAAFSKVDLEQIPSLKAPSEKRAFDGAAIANIRIRHKDKLYESTAFDHNNPPAEIKELVDKIVTFGKQKNGN
ncbi:MAG TPA: hypothetical protein VGB44_03950 [Flavobacterium sp.]|jgi:hypothetical protein